MTPEEFTRQWNSWNLNQRLDWLRFSAGLSGNPAVNSTGEQDRVIREWVTQNYGQYGAYLNHPEIGPILLQSAREGWSTERLQAQIGQTNFWRTTSASQREWDLLASADPAEAGARTSAMVASITTLLNNEGVIDQYTPARITELATQLLRNGAPESQVPALVLADVQYSPTHPTGNLGAMQSAIRARADDYVVPLSDEAAFEWAKKIQMGQATQQGAEEYLRQVAKGQFAHFAQSIDDGLTVKQLLDPLAQRTAQLLGINPEEIDWADSKFSPMVTTVDPTTMQNRAMNLEEGTRYIKGTVDYRQTDRGNAEGSTLVERLAQGFGAS